ncbi:hypothetical protein A9D46_11665 [Photobacterium damselae subsp. damselae]|uniref:glycosyltransferase family 2 protein n=1 Tax=Photobacterium damselae TaxID=38293 RepID=UPI00084AB809|nr:glycosyltransferase family 2 protein [Photobacterium damselae]EJN6961858.1 glycosyltransferase family 2 protein [Photobacterium damselae]OEC83211.1 hypothetical protein A9D46_11665 [Photobacterium damselae subsp. damselae]
MIDSNFMSKNKFVLILLNYNNSVFLEDCLKSIPTDIYDEIIFVDDFSSDLSILEYEEIIYRYNYLKIKSIFNNENLGVKKTLLNVIENNKSDFYQILATDDMFKSISPEISSEFDSNSCLLLSGYKVSHDGEYLSSYNNFNKMNFNSELFREMIFYINPIKAPGFIIPRSIMLKALSNTSVEFEDWPILREIINSGGSIKVSDSSFVFYRQHISSLSSNKNQSKKNWLRLQKKIFLRESLLYNMSQYSKLMVYLQLYSLSDNRLISGFFSLHKLFDFKRIALKIMK